MQLTRAHMTYYEELGIAPNASAADIEHAYRRVAQLLERQQADDKLQAIASAQMRRIEQMVTVLSDPAQRRQYDERLRGQTAAPGSSNSSAPATTSRSRPATEPRPPVWVAAAPDRRSDTSWREYAVWIVLFSLPLMGAGWFWYSAQNSLPAAGRAQASTVPNESALLAATGKPVDNAAASDPTGERARVSHDLAGAWRATLPASSPNLPSATCQLEIQDEHGIVMGTVRFSHWLHPDAKDITLKFHGPVRTDTSQFLWQASDGSSGTLEMEQFAPRLLQLQWTVNPNRAKTEMLQPGTVLLGRIGR